MLSREQAVLILEWGMGSGAIWLGVNRRKLQAFLLAVLTLQAFCWIQDLIGVEFHLLSFPVRELPRSTGLLFTPSFFLFPVICGLVLVHIPREAAPLTRFIYAAGSVSLVTVIELLMERYTLLVRFHLPYVWIYSWLLDIVFFYATYGLLAWFYRNPPAPPADARRIE